MKRLLLLRHAKSDWGTPAEEDFDRPLAPRGIEAAGRMGDFARAEGLLPGRILCSTALRARQTCELFLAALRADTQVEHRDDLYMAGPAGILTAVAGLDDALASAMVIAHDPGMHRLALKMSYGGDPSALDDLRTKFPTAALAVIDVDSQSWQNLQPTAGRLSAFVKPRTLG